MHLTHLHSMRGDPPFSTVQVDFSPFRCPELTWPHEYQGRQLQSHFNGKISSVTINRAQKLGNLAGFRNCGSIGDLDGRKRTAKIGSRIAHGAAGCYGVTAHLAYSLFDSVRRFVLSTPLKPSKDLEELWGS